MDWNKFWVLFHKAWGQAHESSEYDKAVWRDMQWMALKLEDDLKKMVANLKEE
jgi:hypothetical protein